MLRIFISLVWISLYGVNVFSQAESKLEVGGQFSVARFRDSYSGTQFDQYKTDLGFGGRLAFNFNRIVAAEGQVDFFPQSYDREFQKPLLGVFGIKVGRRGKKSGIFLKARPGFLQWSEPLSCPAIVIPGSPPCPTLRRTNFTFDVGGVAEIYTSKRTLIRFDVGDVITRIGNVTGHNLQVSFGVGWRF